MEFEEGDAGGATKCKMAGKDICKYGGIGKQRGEELVPYDVDW
jgi:hypothetical protein